MLLDTGRERKAISNSSNLRDLKLYLVGRVEGRRMLSPDGVQLPSDDVMIIISLGINFVSSVNSNDQFEIVLRNDDDEE